MINTKAGCNPLSLNTSAIGAIVIVKLTKKFAIKYE